MKNVIQYVDSLINDGIPYIDVKVMKEHKEIFRYYNAKGEVTGKERLLMYSCTKPVTVCTAMKLVEDGIISLDDPVEKYLPSYKEVFLLDENGEKRKPKTKMTLRHLFTMTAGITYATQSYPISEAISNAAPGVSHTIAAMEAIPKRQLLTEPGETFRYSLCHDVLGAVIEVASGKKFSEYMKQTILTPLGMNNSSFAVDEANDVYDLYVCNQDGTIVESSKDNALVLSAKYESGGAGLISTVDDYAKFADMLANGGVGENGNRVLREDTVKAIYQKQLSNLSIDSGFTCVQGDDYGYGLGVRTRVNATDWGLPVCEFGWDGAAGSYLMADPVNKISVTVGMHLRTWPIVFRGKHLEIVKKVYENLKI